MEPFAGTTTVAVWLSTPKEVEVKPHCPQVTNISWEPFGTSVLFHSPIHP